MKFVFCSSVEREVFGSLGTHLSIPSVVTRVTYGDTASRNGPLRIARNPTFFFLPSFSDNGKHSVVLRSNSFVESRHSIEVKEV